MAPYIGGYFLYDMLMVFVVLEDTNNSYFTMTEWDILREPAVGNPLLTRNISRSILDFEK